MRKSITLLLLVLLCAAVKGQLMITEIMYQSPAVNGGTDSLEFVEIYNNTNAPIDLTGYTLTGVTFGFPSFILNPGEFVIPCRHGVSMNNYFGAGNYFGFGAGNLSNLGEAIVLKNGSGVTVDSVPYGITAPWPTQGQGDGYSITLCDFSTDNSDGSNWTAANTMVPGGIAQGIQLFANPSACCGNADVTPPTIVSTAFTNYNRVAIQFSEPLNNPSSWIANFTAGSSTIASAAPGMTADSIILTLSTPLTNGDYDMIYVSGVQDTACNEMVTDSFPIVMNLLQPFMSICEIMYDDPTSGDSLEFIELINMEVVPIPFGGLRIQGDINVTIPEITVGSMERIAIARNPQLANQVYGPVNTILGWDSGSLGNTQGHLELWNSSIVLDSFTYYTTGFWPQGANGTGHSIVMCDPQSTTGSPTSWSNSFQADFTVIHQGDSIFATPTRENCRLVGAVDPLVETTEVFPNPFHNAFEVRTASFAITELAVTDAMGRNIKREMLTNGYAKVDLGTYPIGIYFVNLYGADGSVLKVMKMIRL